MNWKAILNPWGEARRLREQNAYLEGRIDELREWADEEIGRAFYRAAEHHWQRNRMVEAQNEHLLKNMTELVNLHPLFVTLPTV